MKPEPLRHIDRGLWWAIAGSTLTFGNPGAHLRWESRFFRRAEERGPRC